MGKEVYKLSAPDDDFCFDEQRPLATGKSNTAASFVSRGLYISHSILLYKTNRKTILSPLRLSEGFDNVSNQSQTLKGHHNKQAYAEPFESFPVSPGKVTSATSKNKNWELAKHYTKKECVNKVSVAKILLFVLR